MTLTSEADAPGLLVEDAQALGRLMTRALGKGFRLVVIEAESPRQRGQLIEWLSQRAGELDARVQELDLVALPRENLWSEFVGSLVGDSEALARVVLAVYGFEELAGEHVEVYRQLNVQRDLFVRDLGCLWVLFVHPHSSRALQDVAPDFCDFCSLWIRAERSSLVGEVQASRLTTARPDLPRPPRDAGQGEDELSGLLDAANRALAMGHHVDARDLLTRFSLAGGASSEHEGRAQRLRSWLELERSRIDEAKEAAERALAWERGRGSEADEAASLYQLAGVLQVRGELDEARDLLERALEIERRVYGTDDHPAVAASLRQLGSVHLASGRLDEARRMLERSLELQIKGLGTELDPTVLVTMHDLGQVRWQLGDFEGARRTLERVLALELEIHETHEHPSVAQTMQSLAVVMQGQGELDGARQLLQRALEIQTKVFGTDEHMGVATSLHALATVMHGQGDLEGARSTLQRVLEISERVYGTEEHPMFAASLHELASVLRAEGALTEARRDLKRVLEIQERVYEPHEHPDIAATLHSLAVVHAQLGDVEEAVKTYERALGIERQLRGSEHFSVAQTEVALAQLLLETGGQPERARALLEHAQPILRETFGAESPWAKRATLS